MRAARVRGGHDDATSPKRPGSNDGVLGYSREPPVKQPIELPTCKAAPLQAVGVSSTPAVKSSFVIGDLSFYWLECGFSTWTASRGLAAICWLGH
jgi:hypothetical protein